MLIISFIIFFVECKKEGRTNCNQLGYIEKQIKEYSHNATKAINYRMSQVRNNFISSNGGLPQRYCDYLPGLLRFILADIIKKIHRNKNDDSKYLVQ